jgi:type IV secretory pathway VirB9-like protein
MRRIALIAILSARVSAALALSVPPPGTADPHIRKVPYDQMNRTVLVGEIGRETTVTFGPNERIGRVVFGQPEAELWDGPDPKDIEKQALRNNLPLWPLKIGATNMQVTTILPDDSQRIYQFALYAKTANADGQDDPDVTFGLIFTYPQEVAEKAKQEASANWRARKEAADKATAKARLAVDVSYGERNWSYVGRPNKAWRANAWPKPEVSDNGELTAFRFQGNVAEPAIYIVDTPQCGPGGHERLAPFADQNGLKVIQTTAQHFRLRLGDAVMEVCNRAWDAGVGQNPGTGTTTPNVIREVVITK